MSTGLQVCGQGLSRNPRLAGLGDCQLVSAPRCRGSSAPKNQKIFAANVAGASRAVHPATPRGKLACGMAIAQWAPWASVFVGGCLTGAALLSLGSEQANVRHGAVATVPAPPAPLEVSDDASEADVEQPHDLAPPDALAAAPPHTSEPSASDEVGLDAQGLSPADVLAELERAYQEHLSDPAVGVAPAQAPNTEAAATPEADPEQPHGDESAPALSTEPALRAEATPEGVRVAQNSKTPTPASDPGELTINIGHASPPQEALGDLHQGGVQQTQVQQVAVVNYQPVYVLSPATTGTAKSTAALTSSARIGLDPWAPVGFGSRHNPWAATSVAGSIWSTGPGGSVWGASFALPR